MKILFVITSLLTGGAEKLVIDMVPKLKEQGNQVDVALFDGHETPFRQKLEATDCVIYSFGRSMYSPLCIFKLMKIMGKYDIVHTHNTYPQLYAAIGSLFIKTKLVTTEHSTNNRRRNNKLFSFVDKWMYSRYQRVICISDKAEENLVDYLGGNRGNIVTIYNGVDVMAFHHAQENLSLRTDSDKFVVVMVASMHWQKDQDTVVKAMALLPHEKFEFWIVGEGDRRPVLEKLAQDLHVKDMVRFFGNRSDIAEILHTADATIMSSHFEGLSLSSIEGMSVGKPFIASDVDGLHETTVGAGILFPHADATRLAEILTLLHDDEVYCHQVADACFERAKKFDIHQTVLKYNDLYKEILN